MNAQRAQEIVSSPVMVDVTCEGAPVYIQHVDERKETARIYPLGSPEEEREVPLYALTEQG
ncbi:small acid-soluble spore protein H [Paenibacillus pinistramenti]|uniref:small acid-soluble spore protein H n=1 Tax=Paenibacillus pinistramenti TaxID=1768003 RepID=UPI0011092586|nr:small acid-soluble spore protein H [Paenibacillus pinistramenti]